MTEKKNPDERQKSAKKKKLKRERKKEERKERKNQARKIMRGTETESSKMTQLLINDKQYHNTRFKSQQLWHSHERGTNIKSKKQQVL